MIAEILLLFKYAGYIPRAEAVLLMNQILGISSGKLMRFLLTLLRFMEVKYLRKHYPKEKMNSFGGITHVPENKTRSF